MSSINPVFILPEAMRQRPGEIAAALHASVTTGVGQLCTNPGLIVVEDSEATRAFLLDLERRVSESPAGTMLTAGICASYRAGAERLARTPGVVQRSGAGTPIGMGQAAASLFTATAETFLAHPELMEEVFGPSTLAVRCANSGQIRAVARALEGQLTVTIHATEGELAEHRDLVGLLETRAGRLVFNGYPTGVEVNHAMVHGGPFPATTDARFSSVGTRSIQRFARPVCFQNMPDALLPDELKENNPLGILRLVDGKWQ
jgi:NADP-dependent aldehyde dehydrogenase